MSFLREVEIESLAHAVVSVSQKQDAHSARFGCCRQHSRRALLRLIRIYQSGPLHHHWV